MDKFFIAFILAGTTFLGSTEGQAANQQKRNVEGRTIQQKDVDLDELHARHPEARAVQCTVSPYRKCPTQQQSKQKPKGKPSTIKK